MFNARVVIGSVDMVCVTEPTKLQEHKYKNNHTSDQFMYLSSHNPGSLEISRDFKQLSTYKPRS
jgi:hypothetical protein